MQEKILVTGGAGFIGTHTVIELIQAGHQVVVVDNLVNSNRKSLEVVERITGVEVPFYEADIRDTDTLRDIFKQEEPTGVIHFAGLKAVGESTRIPLAYYDNNIAGTVSLLKVMEENKNKMGSKITIIVLLLIIIILAGGIYYLVTDVISKDKIIIEKEKTIQIQNEAILKAKKEAEKPKEEKQLSKEDYLRIFKELVGTDFPGDHNTRANDKKIEIIENPKEGMYPNSKYTIRKSGMLKQPSSGIAEGEYNILTKEEVKNQFPDIYNEILAEGKESGILEERNRIKDQKIILNNFQNLLI